MGTGRSFRVVWLFLIAAFTGVLMFASPARAQAPTLVNPGFDTGDLTGWDVFIPPGGDTHASTGVEDYLPRDGAYFAYIKTNGPGSYATVSQTFNALAGEIINGCAFFRANDYLPFDDSSMVVLKDSSGATLVTLFSASVSTVGNFGRTPWTYFESILPSDGQYTIEALIANALDSGVDSYMGLDAVASSNGLANCPPPPPSEISGTKWDDANGDAVRDWDDQNGNGLKEPEEPYLEAGVAGVEVCVSGAANACTFTDADGNYSFGGLNPGSYFVKETLPPLKVQTYPGFGVPGSPHTVFISIQGGETHTAIDFGNRDVVPGSIHGTKWNDADGDGTRDWDDQNGNGLKDETEPYTEPGVADVETCYQSGGGGDGEGASGPVEISQLTGCTFTDANGDYWFMDLGPGYYQVYEVPPPGTAQTFPPLGGGHWLYLDEGQTVEGIDFGNTAAGDIHGTKWNDLDGNGVWDPGEPPVWGVYIELYRLIPPDTVGTLVNATGTDSNGQYWFFGVPAGFYRVVEYPDQGPVFGTQTYPAGGAPQYVHVLSGAVVTGVDFGNHQVPPGVVTGTKWNDLDGDGVFDVGEPGIPFITICASPSGACTSTDGAGNYALTLPAGTATVYEFVGGGLTNTTPVSQTVQVISGGTVAGVNFGNTAPAPPPPEVTVGGGSSWTYNGLPVVYWGSATTYSKDVTAHCLADSPVAVKLVIKMPETGGYFEQMMTNVGGEIWEATFPPFFPHHGTASLTFYVDCPPDTGNFPEILDDLDPVDGLPDTMGTEDEIQHGGNIYIDPSGTIRDSLTGAPVEGATVTLLVESPPTTGSFVIPDPSWHIPPTNPQVTLADGKYGWVVIPGVWKVRAEKDGCTTAESDPQTIPPAVTDLDLFIACSAQLTLVKTVVNDNGGTKAVADFALFVDGNPATSGVPVTLAAGPHTASETPVAGYAASAWGGDCNPDGTITLALAENKTCTVTNDDVPTTTETARAKKEAARALLQGLFPTDDRNTDRRLASAIKELDRSLAPELWVDGSHLSAKHGKKVFDRERKAVDELSKIKGPAPAVGEAVQLLLMADRMLAQTAIDEATAAGGRAKNIAKAQKAMADAAAYASSGKFEKAIQEYEKAWKEAQKALSHDDDDDD